MGGPRKGEIPARERILDAAEELFSVSGYDGVPIRKIMSTAKVELGSAHHYFGRKEELLRQIIARRADELAADAMARLDAVLLQTPAATLEELIAAFIAPTLDRLTKRGAGWRNYIRLAALLTSIDKEQIFNRLAYDYMRPVIDRFLEGVKHIYPDCSAQTVLIFYWYMNSAMLHLIQGTKMIDVTSRGSIKGSDYALVRKTMPPFFAAGFRQLMANDRQLS